MIVQSTDGHYYLNPSFQGPNWVVKMVDCVELKYRQRSSKPVSWKTARKVLRPAGIKAAFYDFTGFDSEIIGDKLQTVTVYGIRLLGPIPTPCGFEARVGKPDPNDFDLASWE